MKIGKFYIAAVLFEVFMDINFRPRRQFIIYASRILSFKTSTIQFNYSAFFCLTKSYKNINYSEFDEKLFIQLVQNFFLSQVYLSSRRGAWIISRKFLCGIPADAFANTRLLFSLPKSFLKWAFQFFANLHFNHGLYGLKPQNR